MHAINKVTLTIEGVNDPYGYPIMSVQIRRIIDTEAEQTIDNTI